MKKLIFYVNNFFGSGYFFDPWYLKNDQKIAGTKNFFVSKNQFCHVRQPCKGFFEICIVFSHFSARASNGPQYSNFGNKCPKLGPGTLEDMLFTNLGETLDSVPSGIVLLYITHRSVQSQMYIKNYLVFGICPIILWYLGYLKQEKTKKSSESPFREDRLKFFPYKSSRERKARITKWSLWRSGWSKKSH